MASLLSSPAFPAFSVELSGINVCEREGIGVANVLVRPQTGSALAQRLRAQFAIELPRGRSCTVAGDMTLVGTAPGAWLALHDRECEEFAPLLRERLGDLASISDQSGGYAVVRLSGARVRAVLSKLISVDIHPRAFHVGAAAVTVADHVGVVIWRREDAADRSAVFDMAIVRSFALSFFHSLLRSARQ